MEFFGRLSCPPVCCCRNVLGVTAEIDGSFLLSKYTLSMPRMLTKNLVSQAFL